MFPIYIEWFALVQKNNIRVQKELHLFVTKRLRDTLQDNPFLENLGEGSRSCSSSCYHMKVKSSPRFGLGGEFDNKYCFQSSYKLLKLFCLIYPVFFITEICFYILNQIRTIYFLLRPCEIPKETVGWSCCLNV